MSLCKSESIESARERPLKLANESENRPVGLLAWLVVATCGCCEGDEGLEMLAGDPGCGDGEDARRPETTAGRVEPMMEGRDKIRPEVF